MDLNIKVLLISCTCPEPSTPSLGITSIASYLLGKNISVKVFDDAPYMVDIVDEKTDPREMILSVQKTNPSDLYRLPFAERFNDLIAMIRDFNPNIVGASTTEATYNNAIEYFDLIKVNFPLIKTVIGGAFAIIAPDIAILHNSVDMVAIGEGELAIEEYCNCLEANRDPLNTKGLWIKKDGKIVKNGAAQLIDIDNIPPLRFDLYQEKRLYRPISGAVRRMLPLEVSRGCMYNCTFCASPVFSQQLRLGGKWLRNKSIEKIEEDIIAYKKYFDPQYFFIISETFLGATDDYLDEFTAMYCKYKIPFWMNTRPETITEEKIKKLKAVGLERMSVGVECGNEKYRSEFLNRKYTNEHLEKVFTILQSYDIKVTANVMIGLPDETREMIFDSIRLIKVLKPASVGLAVFQPYKGTKMYEYVVNKNYYNSGTIINSTCYKPNFYNPNLATEEIMKLLYTFNLYVKTDEKKWSVIDAIDISNEIGMLSLKRLLNEFSAS